jgi:7-carboxy-7-deazaguanine synthase
VTTYPITRIFRSLQGEGHFVGYPMTFIRLAGCSVIECSIRGECDEYPWKSSGSMALADILAAVYRLAPAGIVCLTGGEPTDHDLVPLVAELRDAGYAVHIETSGERSIAGIPFDWITVSPKSLDYKQRIGHTLKLVVRPEWEWPQVVAFDNGTQFFHRYLQPLTVGSAVLNLKHVTDMLLEFGGDRWALSTQAHKVWSLP